MNNADLHTWQAVVAMTPPGNPQYGTLQVEYEVRRYTDVRNLNARRGYVIRCRLRFVYPNNGLADIGITTVTSYAYPIMFTATMGLKQGDTCDSYSLIDLTPKTLNSSVSTNQTGSSSATSTATSQVTAGSSTSETNTWDIGGSLPFSLSGSGGRSTTRTSFNETSVGASDAQTLGSAASDSMSVKDWASYVSVDVGYQSPTWIWAQAFPWDVLRYHVVSGVTIALPQDIQDLLYTTATGVLPPSQLSLFGVSFSMSAAWLYLVKDAVDAVDSVSFSHLISPYTATHGLVKGAFQASLSAGPVFQYGTGTGALDLGLLALDPISSDTPANAAIVGFTPTQFTVTPAAGATFGITSTSNLIVVRGSGFTAPTGADAPMTANLTGAATATMTVYFKTMEGDADYTLFLKNWLLFPTGCVMTIVINGNPPITRHIDSLEAGSGSDNLARIILRRKRYTSDEYYDYLVKGLNTITIALASAAPAGTPPPACGYAIRALAIG